MKLTFTPTVHLNGTPQYQLIEQYSSVCAAINNLKNKMAEATPHGRDYYPQGNEATKKAIDEWVNVTKQINELNDQVIELIERISEQRK